MQFLLYPRPLRLILKFGLDGIYSFRDIAIFVFCRFGWKLPIHAHLGEGLGAKGTSFRGNTPFEP